MKYENISSANFIARPNRFIAHVDIDGQCHVCHVKNTGRCKELLTENALVFIQKSDNPTRKTAYDLIAVKKGKRIINMDSNAPNRVFGEHIASGGLGFIPDYIKAEKQHGDSRFDFYFEHGDVKCFAEVKGVTLEEDNVARFPDAPTERGIKHLHGLINCVKEGYEAYAVFVVQMENIRLFEPNRKTHPQFADALREAEEAGVKVLVLGCSVEADSLNISYSIPYNI